LTPFETLSHIPLAVTFDLGSGFLLLGIFWAFQFLGFLFWDRQLFDSHKDKVIWFFVLVVGTIFGAIWYSVWKREQRAVRRQVAQETKMDNLVEALKSGE